MMTDLIQIRKKSLKLLDAKRKAFAELVAADNEINSKNMKLHDDALVLLKGLRELGILSADDEILFHKKIKALWDSWFKPA